MANLVSFPPPGAVQQSMWEAKRETSIGEIYPTDKIVNRVASLQLIDAARDSAVRPTRSLTSSPLMNVEELNKTFLNLVRDSHDNCLGLDSHNSDLELFIKSSQFGEIEIETLGKALMEPVRYGYERSLAILIGSSRFGEISVENLETALIEAACKGHDKCLKLLMDSPRFKEVCPAALGKILIGAVLYKKDKCLELLVQSPRFQEVSIGNFEEAVQRAATENHTKCFEFLVKSPRFKDFSIDALGKILSAIARNAATVDNPTQGCLELFINSSRFKDVKVKDLGNCLVTVVRDLVNSVNREKHLQLLMASPRFAEIDPKDLKMAAKVACSNCLALLKASSRGKEISENVSDVRS